MRYHIWWPLNLIPRVRSTWEKAGSGWITLFVCSGFGDGRYGNGRRRGRKGEEKNGNFFFFPWRSEARNRAVGTNRPWKYKIKSIAGMPLHSALGICSFPHSQITTHSQSKAELLTFRNISVWPATQYWIYRWHRAWNGWPHPLCRRYGHCRFSKGCCATFIGRSPEDSLSMPTWCTAAYGLPS